VTSRLLLGLTPRLPLALALGFLLATTLQPLCFGREPKARVETPFATPGVSQQKPLTIALSKDLTSLIDEALIWKAIILTFPSLGTQAKPNLDLSYLT